MNIEIRRASAHARRERTDEAEQRSETYEEVFCLLSREGVPIGVADWHRDHPAKGIAYLGLLLIVDRLHGEKMGFRPTGQTYRWRGERLESQVTELEKPVVPAYAGFSS